MKPSAATPPSMPALTAAGKVCVITGAAGLLGQAFASALAAAGARLALVDIDAAKGRQALQKIQTAVPGVEVAFYETDTTSEKDVAVLRTQVLQDFGRIDALINNAYPRNARYGRKFEQVTYEDFCDNLSRHVGGYFLMAREMSAAMPASGGGAIVNLGSIYGSAAPRFEIYEGTPMTMPVEYAAIKGGIINLTRYLASYLGPAGIRVNALSPGGVYDGQPESFVQKYSAKVPLGSRMATTDDLVGTVIYLVSDASRYVTGQDIIVDGGWSL